MVKVLTLALTLAQPLALALTLTRWPMINLLTYCLAPLPLLAYWSIHGGDSLLGD